MSCCGGGHNNMKNKDNNGSYNDQQGAMSKVMPIMGILILALVAIFYFN